MPIRYKVVGPLRRSSCYHIAYAIGRYLRKVYIKGKIIEAIEGSPGIFTFDTKKNASFFIDQYDSYDLQIIKVRGIGKGTRNIKMLRVSDLYEGFPREKLFRFMKNKPSSYIMKKEEIQQSFKGTIVYKSVKVLE